MQHIVDAQPATFPKDSPRAVQELLMRRLRASLRLVVVLGTQAAVQQLQSTFPGRRPAPGIAPSWSWACPAFCHCRVPSTHVRKTQACCAGLAKLPIVDVPVPDSAVLADTALPSLTGCAEGTVEQQAAQVRCLSSCLARGALTWLVVLSADPKQRWGKQGGPMDTLAVTGQPHVQVLAGMHQAAVQQAQESDLPHISLASLAQSACIFRQGPSLPRLQGTHQELAHLPQPAGVLDCAIL